MEVQDIYQEINWKQMESQLETVFPQWELSFSELVKEVSQGSTKGFWQIITEKLGSLFLGECAQIKQIAITIIIVILISSVFAAFKDVFQNHQIAEISFYINYIILMLLFLHLFSETLQLGEETLKKIEQFIISLI